jgi:hypothetical protein
LAATIYQQLGVPSHLELLDEQGRPMTVCPGNPVISLLS